MNRFLLLLPACLLALFGSGCEDEPGSGAGPPGRLPGTRPSAALSASERVSWPRFILRAEGIWQLNLPKGERFDASGLAFNSKGELLTLSDRGPAIYRIEFRANTNAADLIKIPTCFTPAQLRPFVHDKIDRYDSEGIAIDEHGKIYVCEEANRWVLRCDPVAGTVERLAIDWTPVKKYFDLSDSNASFEGIAVAEGRLYVANERQLGRIIVVDLAESPDCG